MNVHRQVSLIIVSFFLMLSGYGFAQNTKIDSLKRIVETGVKDTSMVVTLNALSKEVLNTEDIKQSLVYARKANELVVTTYRPLEIYTFLILEYLVLILIVSFFVRKLEKNLKTD